MPIGNLTSQHDANFDLNDFDWMFDIFLHIYWHGRYVDDFYMIHAKKEVLITSIPKVREYLARIGVTLHPRKIELQECSRGVKFTGMVVKNGRIYASNRTVANFENLIHHMNTPPEDYSIAQLEHYVSSINSYLGYMKHCDSYDIRKRIILKMDLQFYRHLYVQGHYECVRIKNKYKSRNIVIKKLENKKNAIILLDNYYNDTNTNGRRNRQDAG